MTKILLVEDDRAIASLLLSQLSGWGYQTKAIENFGRVTEEFTLFSPDIVLMDVSLPEFNGFYWCGEIRRLSQVPVIFISSRTESMNIVTAVNMGADDYITKPFDFDVLLAKIKAVLRRAGNAAPQIASGRVSLLPATCQADVAGNVIDLTKNESRLLQTLLEYKGRIVSREQLMLRVWDNDSFIDDNTLSVNMARLRKKLTDAGADVIETKKGAGYILHD